MPQSFFFLFIVLRAERYRMYAWKTHMSRAHFGCCSVRHTLTHHTHTKLIAGNSNLSTELNIWLLKVRQHHWIINRYSLDASTANGVRCMNKMHAALTYLLTKMSSDAFFSLSSCLQAIYTVCDHIHCTATGTGMASRWRCRIQRQNRLHILCLSRRCTNETDTINTPKPMNIWYSGENYYVAAENFVIYFSFAVLIVSSVIEIGTRAWAGARIYVDIWCKYGTWNTSHVCMWYFNKRCMHSTCNVPQYPTQHSAYSILAKTLWHIHTHRATWAFFSLVQIHQFGK